MDEKKVNLLNKLIALYNHDRREPQEPNILHHIIELARQPEDYQREMQAIETILHPTASKQNLPMPSDKPWSSTAEAIYQIALQSAPIRILLATQGDRLSTAPPDQVLVFSQMADLMPDPNLDSQSMLYSADPTLMRVLEFASMSPLISLESLSVDDLFREDLLKFISLHEEHRDIAAKLATLARSIHWHTVLLQLEAHLIGNKPVQNLSGEVLLICREWQALMTQELLVKLFSSPHVRAMSQDLLALVGVLTFNPTGESIIETARLSPGMALQHDLPAIEQRKLLARAVLELLIQQHKPYLETISIEISLRIEVAQHCLEVRQFAKLDAFVYRWPEIARRAMANYASLEDVERYVVEGITTPPEQFFSPMVKYLYERCVQDEILLSFLRLRPYFMNMDENKLVQYRPSLPIVIDEPEINKLSMQSPQLLIETQNSMMLPSTPNYQQVIIRLRSTQRPNGMNTQSVLPEQGGYSLEIVAPSDAQTNTHNFSVQALQESLDSFYSVPLSGGSEHYLNDPKLKNDARLAEQLARAGSFLLQETFGTANLEILSKALQADQRIRLLLETEVPELIQLPWEWMWVAGRTGFVATDRSYSLVRALPSLPSVTGTSLAAPPRILALLSGSDSATIQAITGMTEFFSQALPNRGASAANVLTREQTTPTTLARNLVEVKPSILHIEPPRIDWTALVRGSSELPSTETPALALADQTNTIYWISAQELWDMLQKAGVSLVVFGSNPYADVSPNPLLQLVLALIRAGLPAALVPLRQVDETSAHLFVQEFYRSLLRGRQLEIAIIDARTKLAYNNYNWSTFAFFANPAALEVASIS